MTDINDLTGRFQGLRVRTVLEQEAADMLEKQGIKAGVPTMAPKTGGKRGNIKLFSNVYPIAMKTIPVYRYDIAIIGYIRGRDGMEKGWELTRKYKGDMITVDRRALCRDVFNAFEQLAISQGRIQPNVSAYYDLQSILFSLKEINLPKTDNEKFMIASKTLSERWARYVKFEVQIRPVTESFQMELNDLSSISLELTEVENRLTQFLDIATSQHVMFTSDDHITFTSSCSYLLNPSKYGFDEQTEGANFEDLQAYLGFGAQKGVRYVEGPRVTEQQTAALVVQSKKTPFHAVTSVLSKAQALVKPMPLRSTPDIVYKLNKFLKGLTVETTYGKTTLIDIRTVDPESAQVKKIETAQHGILTVQDYFRRHHKIELSDPQAPLISAKGREGPRYFPMELLKVCDNQRVKTGQMPPGLTQNMIRKCAVPPAILREQDKKTAASLNLWNSKYLQDAQITISKEPMEVYAHQLAHPNFRFGAETARLNPIRFNWTSRDKFLIPANCTMWAVYSFLDTNDNREQIRPNELENFVTRFLAEARSRGMKFADPGEIMAVRGCRSDQIKNNFERAAGAGCEFLLCIHNDGLSGDQPHAEIKYNERQTEIVTQCMRIGCIRKVVEKNQRETLQNIVNKTNVKLGGLNYSLVFNSAKEALPRKSLIIGFGVNHPGFGSGDETKIDVNNFQGVGRKGEAKDPPTVIGYSANVGKKHEFEFVGDFVFQAPMRDEKTSVITEIVRRCLEKYQKNRGFLPEHVILYRNGCSEGQFRMVLKYEIPLLKTVLSKACRAALTVIVVNKMQNIRFFNEHIDPTARAPDQNIKPGTVVDTVVVHPLFNEFFLNSHVALQGMAKTPKYTVLYDESKFPMIQLQEISHQLCFGHQIVYLPTSLPSPVYIANRYAERGRKLYARWMDANVDHELTYAELGKAIGYFDTQYLSDLRLNA